MQERQSPFCNVQAYDEVDYPHRAKKLHLHRNQKITMPELKNKHPQLRRLGGAPIAPLTEPSWAINVFREGVLVQVPKDGNILEHLERLKVELKKEVAELEDNLSEVVARYDLAVEDGSQRAVQEYADISKQIEAQLINVDAELYSTLDALSDINNGIHPQRGIVPV